MNPEEEAQQQRRRRCDGCFQGPDDKALVPSEKVCTRYFGSPLLHFPLSSLLSSLDAACAFLSTEGSSAWIMQLRFYWCIKLRVWFLSRPCHQSQFARALAECNISLIGSTRKLRRWTVLIREEIIKLGAPGKISPSEHYCKGHKKINLPSLLCFAEWDKEETRNVDRWRRFWALSSLQPFSRFFSPVLPPTSSSLMQE